MKNLKLKDIFRLISLVIFVIGIHLFIEFCGGTNSGYTKLNFIPIIIATFYWGLKGGVSFSLYTGIYSGLFVYMDVVNEISQPTDKIISRILMYILVSGLLSFMIKRIKILENEKLEKAKTDAFSGLFNYNKLIEVVKDLYVEKEQYYFGILRFDNIYKISNYVDDVTIKSILQLVVDETLNYCNCATAFFLNTNEMAFIFKKNNEKELEIKLNKLIKKKFDFINIKDSVFNLNVKMGLVLVADEDNPDSIIKKTRIAIETIENDKTVLCFFNSKIEEESRFRYMVSDILIKSIEKNEFYTVLQPIIDLESKSIVNAEILLRWKRPDGKLISPSYFIDVAENSGLISHLTKYVLNKAEEIMRYFKVNEINSKVSINLSPNDLYENYLFEFINNIDTNKILDNDSFCFEITERVSFNDSYLVSKFIEEGCSKNFNFELDDFGTGYNSLIFLNENGIKVFKIDRYFIDLITNEAGRTIVSNIIQLIHGRDGVVIAEGVESIEQLMILKELGCDQIQGFYFSKPLKIDTFKSYYESFDMDDYI